MISELILVADADTAVLCSLEGAARRIADKYYFGQNLNFIADTDTEKSYFRMISAMNLDKQYYGGSKTLRFSVQERVLGTEGSFGRGHPHEVFLSVRFATPPPADLSSK